MLFKQTSYILSDNSDGCAGHDGTERGGHREKTHIAVCVSTATARPVGDAGRDGAGRGEDCCCSSAQ